MDFNIACEAGRCLPMLAFAMMALDIATGIAKAAKAGEVCSSKLREGLWHKAGFVGLMALALALNVGQGMADLGFEIPTMGAVCVYVVFTEAVSVAENLCALNPAIAESPVGRLLAQGAGKEGGDE